MGKKKLLESPKTIREVTITEWFKQRGDDVFLCYSFDGGKTHAEILTVYKEIPVIEVKWPIQSYI